MDRESRRHFEAYRRSEAGDVENALLDDVAAGELDRGEFLRRASVLGLSGSVIGSALALARRAGGGVRGAGARSRRRPRPGRHHPGADEGPRAAHARRPRRVRGGRHRGRVPHPHDDDAAAAARSSPSAGRRTRPRPCGRSSSARASSSRAARASAPTTSSRRTSASPTPKSGSQAISAFGGVLSPSGVRKVDSHTVAFHLDAPNANFPYLTCETTYQAIILPADYKVGTFTQTPQTTAAFKLTSYTPGVGATYEAFDGWWGGTPALSGVDATFYNEDAARDRGAARRPARPRRPDQHLDRPRRAQEPEPDRDPRPRRDAPRGADPHRHHVEPVPRLPGPAGARAHARPPGDRQDAVLRLRRHRQRLAVRAGLPVDEQERRPAAQGHPQGQAADGGGRPREGLLGHAHDREGRRDPAAGADHPALGEADRDRHQPQGARPRAPTSPARSPARRRAGARRRG